MLRIFLHLNVFLGSERKLAAGSHELLFKVSLGVISSHQLDIKSVENTMWLGCIVRIPPVIRNFIILLWGIQCCRSVSIEIHIRVTWFDNRPNGVLLDKTGVQSWPEMVNVWSWELLRLFHIRHINQQILITNLLRKVVVNFVVAIVAFFTFQTSFIDNTYCSLSWLLLGLKMALCIRSGGWSTVLELALNLRLDTLVPKILSTLSSIIFSLIKRVSLSKISSAHVRVKLISRIHIFIRIQSFFDFDFSHLNFVFNLSDSAQIIGVFFLIVLKW